MARGSTARLRVFRAPLVALIATVALGVAAATALAATAPAPALAKKADAICTMENARRARNPDPPRFKDPAKATVAQLKGAGGYLARDLAITRDEASRVFSLGTPSEPASATAWRQLDTLLTTRTIPLFARAVSAAKAGDVNAVAAAFAASDRYDARENALVKLLGLKVCGH